MTAISTPLRYETVPPRVFLFEVTVVCGQFEEDFMLRVRTTGPLLSQEYRITRVNFTGEQFY